MKNCFAKKLSPTALAILDCCDYYGKGMIITRINVPAEFRGQGHGKWLLSECVKEADRTGTTLFLEVAPSGPLNTDALIAWYNRQEFRYWKGIYRRIPRMLR